RGGAAAPVRLVEAIDRQDPEEVEPARGHAGDADRDPGEVRHRVLERDLGRERRSHLVRREAQVGDEQDGTEITRGVEPDRLYLVAYDGTRGDPAEERGRAGV